jgi:hypothetical protein
MNSHLFTRPGIVTERDLESALDITPKTSLNASKVTSQQFGPGQLSTWQCYMKTQKNCWSNKEIRSTASKKRKIIFSASVSAISSNPYHIRELIENYEVYLWPGGDTPFSTVTPISSIGEFFQQRDSNKLFAATAAEVKKSLADQNKNGEEFLIYDRARGRRTGEALNNDDAYALTLDPRHVYLDSFYYNSENIESLFQHQQVGNKEITKVTVFSPTLKTIQVIKKLFPNCREIECQHAYLTEETEGIWRKALEFDQAPSDKFEVLPKNASITLIRTSIPASQEKENNLPQLVHLDFCPKPGASKDGKNRGSGRWMNGASLAALAVTKNLKLTAESKDKIEYLFNFEKAPFVEKLEVAGLCSLSELDLTCLHNRLRHLTLENAEEKSSIPPSLDSLKKLQHLRLKNFDLESKPNLILDLLPELEELVLENCNLHELKASPGNKIKRLVIKDCHELAALDLNQFPDLEILVLVGNMAISHLDLSRCRKLRELTLDIQAPTHLTPAPRLERLVYSGKRISGNPAPDVSQFPQLKLLSLDTVSFSELDLSKHSELLECTFNSVNFNHVRANGLRKLESFVLSTEAKSDCQIHLNSCPGLYAIEVEAKGNIHLDFSGSARITALLLNTPETAFIKKLEDHKQIRYLGLASKNMRKIMATVPKGEDCYNFTHANASPAFLKKIASAADESISVKSTPVSLYRYSDNAHEFDADTAPSKAPLDFSDSRFSLTLMEKEGADSDNYRQGIAETVNYEAKSQKISFPVGVSAKDCVLVKIPSAALETKQIAATKEIVEKDEKQGAGYFCGSFVPGKLYSLATQHAMEKDSLLEIHTDPPGAVNVFFHERHKQFYLQVPADAPQREIKILYRYRCNPTYREKPSPDDTPLIGAPPLSPEIAAALKKEIAHNPALSFLDEKDLTVPKSKKLELLKKYCETFSNEMLSGKPISGLDALTSIIHEKKGSCRHRSKVFMILAHYIDVPVRCIVNEQHSFCEVPYTNGIYRFDLGGGFRPDATPEDRRQNKWAEPALPPAKKIETPRDQTLRALYKDEFKELSGTTQLKSVDTLLEPHTLHPVLELSDEKEIGDVKNVMIAKLRKANTPYLYIPNPECLAYYFEHGAIEDKQWIKKKSELYHILKNGGVLLINWSTFSATQKAHFKSLIDSSDANLFGEKVSPDVHAVGFTTKKDEACSAFNSRRKKYTVDSSMIKSLADASKKMDQKAKASKDVKVIEVNLYHQSNWHDLLLGRIIADEKGNGLRYEEGPLFRAIRQGCHLHIYNPPDDREFYDLIDRIRHERRTLLLSDEPPIPDDFVIELKTRAPNNTVPGNVHLFHETKIEKGAPSSRVYIGSHNWDDLFAGTKIENQKNHSIDGLLVSEKKSLFYITNSIDTSDWEKLRDYAEKHPSEQFYFELAPQVAIKDVKHNTSPPLQVEMKAWEKTIPSVISSNDPDLVCDDILLKNSEALVVNLTPTMGYSDLISVSTQKQDEKKQIEFVYEKKFVLEALEKGRTVVLKGISPTLYQWLMPLLLETPPAIYSNGQRIMVPGKLICVMSNEMLQCFPFHPVNRFDYSQKEYENRFENKDDRVLAQHIQQYFTWLNRLPHHEPQTVTFARLKNMVDRLNNAALSKVHAHNPLKEFLLEYYPKGEPTDEAKREEYAYMNVLGKYFIKPDDRSPRRQTKLLAIHAKDNLSQPENIKKNLWRILNCFNGAELQRILGPDLSAKIDNENGRRLTLKPIELENLRNYLSRCLLEKAVEEKKSSRAEKTKHYIQAYTQVNGTRILVFTGMPGVGKTHAVDELKKEGTVYHAHDEAQLIAWLTHRDDGRPCYLELSEYNMTPDGTYEFLEGIRKNPPVVTYKGVSYPLSANHWVIATGNPPSAEEGRRKHRLFEQHGRAVAFEMPEKEFTENHILKPNLQMPLAKAQSGILLEAFEMIKRHNPMRHYSFRDLESLATRVNFLIHPAHVSEQLYEACATEFAGAIARTEQRARYLAELRQLFHLPAENHAANALIAVSPNWFVPREAIYAVNSIRQALEMRRANRLLGKQIILLEGDPGVGKSALIDEMTERHCIKINAGEDGAKEALRAAFAERAIISLEEFNLDEDKSLEKLLIELLEKEKQDVANGVMPNQRTLIFASQNSASEAGRSFTSLAIQNRSHHVYLDTYSRETLEAIAEQRGVEKPAIFVDVFLNMPDANMRMFYRHLDLFQARRNIEKKLPRGLINDLLNAITKMEKYGKKLIDENEKPLGKNACQLAGQLREKTTEFFKKYSLTAPENRSQVFNKFDAEARVLLTSRKTEFSTHRHWEKNIIANVAACLVGIGLFILAYQAMRGSVTGVFRTKRAALSGDIESGLDRMRRAMVGPLCK